MPTVQPPKLILFFVFLFFGADTSSAQPVRGIAGDWWADKILGQIDFGQINANQVGPKRLFNARGVVVDNALGHDRMYVYDSGNNRVLGVALPSGAVTSGQGATVVLGQPDFVHSACNGDSNWQNYPTPPLPNASCLCSLKYDRQSPLEAGSAGNMAVDSQGNLYVPDYFNNRVLRYDWPVTNAEPAAAVWGQGGLANFTGNQPGLTNDTLAFYRGADNSLGAGVAVDQHGNLWVADNSNHRALRFPNLSGIPGGLPSATADVVLGQANFISSVNPAGPGDLSRLYFPIAIRVDANDNVYVADSLSRILAYQPVSGAGSNPVYSPTANAAITQYLTTPRGLELDPTTGGMWVPDMNGHQILHFQISASPLNPPVTKVLMKDLPQPASSPLCGDTGVTGTRPNFTDSLGQQTASWSMCDVRGSVGVDLSGNVYVSSNLIQDVWRFPSPIPALQAGIGPSADVEIFKPNQFIIVNNIGTADMYNPHGVAVAQAIPTPQIIVANMYRLMYWNMPAGGPAGLVNGQAPDGLAGTAYPFHTVTSFLRIREDNAVPQRLWVAAAPPGIPYRQFQVYNLPLTNNQMAAVTVAMPVSVAGRGVSVSWGEVEGFTPDPTGTYLWISDKDNNRALRIRDALTAPVVDIVLGQLDPGYGNPVGTRCNLTGTGNPCTSTNVTAYTLNLPGAVRLDHQGNLYLADHSLEGSGNWRMLRWNANQLPAAPATCLFAIPATAVYGTLGGSFTVFEQCASLGECGHWDPAFTSDDRIMVVGQNSQLPNSRFPMILSNPTAGDFPIGSLNDYGPQTYAATFDGQDNLYALEMNRNRLMIYLAPFPTPTPTHTSTPTETPSRTPTGTLTPSITPTYTPSPTFTPNYPACCVTVWSQPPGTLSGARGIAIDYGRNAGYVVDGNTVRKFDLGTGALTGTVGPAGQFAQPQGIAMGGDGYLYVANHDQGVVLKVDVGSGAALVTIGAGDGLGFIRGAYPDANGDVYISSNNNVIYRYVLTAPVTCGAPFTYNKVTLTLGGGALNTPTGVAKVGNRLFVADSLNRRVVMYQESAAGSNNYNLATTLPAGPVTMNPPAELMPDLAGNIYVADFSSQAYMVYGLDGAFKFDCQNPAYGNPFGIAVDVNGNVYLSDVATGRVLKVAGGCMMEPLFATSTPTFTCNPDTPTFTFTITPTQTWTPTLTLSPTPTETPSPILTDTATHTTTQTPSFTSTETPSFTPTMTNTWTHTPTSNTTVTFTDTPTPSPTPTGSSTPTWSPTPSFTSTPTSSFLIPNLILYPNPADGTKPVSVHVPGLTGPSDVTVRIFTTAYRKVLEQPFPQQPVGVDVSFKPVDKWGAPLASGLYYVVITVNGNKSVGKLLILR